MNDIDFTKDYIVARDSFDNKFVIFRDEKYRISKARRCATPGYDSDDRRYLMFCPQKGLNIIGDEMDVYMHNKSMSLRQVRYFITYGNTTGVRPYFQLCVQFDTAAEAFNYIKTLQSLEES